MPQTNEKGDKGTMKGKLFVLGLGFSLCALAVSGCDILTGGSAESEIPEATSDVSGEGGMIGMANPASVYCEDQGYTLEIRSDAEGNEYGVCLFPDGSECEEWAFFRGECAPGSQAVEEPVAEPAEEPAAPVNAVDVTCEWVSFSYDASLASGVTGEIMPAEDGVSAWGGSPEHVECAFNDYILPNTFHAPRLCVYPIADFVAVAPSAETTVTNMEQLLAARPEILPGAGFSSPDVPFLPLFNAAQMVRAGGEYLDFQNGMGVRFLTQYGQAFYPINNTDLFYTFQGVTSDGYYYVAAILPVSNPILPTGETEIPGGDFDAFANNFETYAADIAQQLEGQPASSFTPDLALLDAMIQSLVVNPAP
jgi:putative hemolysin